MCYDPDSPSAKKGKLGEKIVKSFLENSWGAKVERVNSDDKSLIDFYATWTAGGRKVARYIEVKTRNPFKYSYGQYPCFCFSPPQIDAYNKFADEHNSIDCELWVVNPDDGKIYLGVLGTSTHDEYDSYFLNKKRSIKGKKFPFEQDTELGLMRHFHLEQFGIVAYIPADNEDLIALRELYKQEETAPVATLDTQTILDIIDAADVGLDAKDFSEEAQICFKSLIDEFGKDLVLDAVSQYVNEYGASNFIYQVSKCTNLNDFTIRLRRLLNEILYGKGKNDDSTKVAPTLDVCKPIAETDSSAKKPMEDVKNFVGYLAFVFELKYDEILSSLFDLRQEKFNRELADRKQKFEAEQAKLKELLK